MQFRNELILVFWIIVILFAFAWGMELSNLEIPYFQHK